MGAMTEAIDRADPTSGDPVEVTPDDSRDVWISVALVVGLVIVHLWMAMEVATLQGRCLRQPRRDRRCRGGEPRRNVLPAVPLALVVLFWARSRSWGVLAAFVALGGALLVHVRGVAFVRMVESGHVDAADRMVTITQWAVIVLLPTLAALAWCIARRRGSAWVPGLLVAGALATPLRYIDLEDTGITAATAAMIYAFVLHVVPAVLAGLACWWLEWRQRPA